MTEHNPATLVMIAAAMTLITAVAVIVAALVVPVALVVPATLIALANSRVTAALLVAALVAASLLILIGPLILRARARGDAGNENHARCYDRQFLHGCSPSPRFEPIGRYYSSAMSWFLNE